MRLFTEVMYSCEPQRYLEEYFDASKRAEREVKGCGNISFTVLRSRREGETWSHVAEVVSRLDAPLPVRKIFGESTRMEEHASWRRDTNRIDVEYRPDTLRSKVSIRGTIQVEPAGVGACRVQVEVELLFKVFGVGRILERIAAKRMPEALEKDSAYFNAHMAGASSP